MRVSSRLLVPALTILSWSIESAYASYRPPSQGLYKRYIRSADYSTSTSPSYDSSTGAKSPGNAPSSAPQPGLDAAPQTSTKARRATRATKTGVPGLTHQSEKRNPDNEDSKPRGTVDVEEPRVEVTSSHQKRQHSDSGKAIHVRDALYKRTTSFAAHGNHVDVTSHSLETRGKKTYPVRRSSTDLDTLHIARGIQKRKVRSPLTVGRPLPIPKNSNSDPQPSVDIEAASVGEQVQKAGVPPQ